MSTLFQRTWKAARRTSANVLGEVQETSVPFTFRGSIQPESAKDQSLREEGRFDEGRVKIYTGTRLQVGVDGGSLLGDIVEYGGHKYEVIQEVPYLNGLISHRKYVATLRSGK